MTVDLISLGGSRVPMETWRDDSPPALTELHRDG
jgi:hypothetical protein